MAKRDLEALRSPEAGVLEKRGTALAAQASAEGCILLENSGAFPIEPQPAALYGYGGRLTMVHGIGSGDVTYRYYVNIETGLENAGFTITTKPWLDQFDKIYSEYRRALLEDVAEESKRTGVDNLHVLYGRPHILPDCQDITEEDVKASGTDLAIYVISRKEGEGRDNRYVKGEYLLSDQEEKSLRFLRKSYKVLAVVLNTGTPIDMNGILSAEPDAVLEAFQGGAEIGTAVAGILSGKINPSGKTTSTWAKDYFDYPNSREFGENGGDQKNKLYKEGIYMGYRYFDSFGVEPRYPFGYGLSYTTFAVEDSSFESYGSTVKVSERVTNTGSIPGKEVVQVYLSAPAVRLDQPYQVLCAYKKTKLLNPGESEVLELEFKMEDFTSYDAENCCYVLEGGDYIVRAGTSSRSTHIAGVVRLTGDRVTREVRNLFHQQIKFDDLKAPKHVLTPFEETEKSAAPVVVMNPDDIPACGKVTYSGDPDNIFGGKIDPSTVNTGRGRNVFLKVPEMISLEQVRSGEYTLEEMIASLDEEELKRLAMGEEFHDPRFIKCNNGSYHVPGAAGETTNWFLKNRPERQIPYTVAADGPAGLRLIPRIQADKDGNITVINPLMSFESGEFVSPDNTGYSDDLENYYQHVTCLPISIQLASTWNTELMEKIGDVIGAEMARYDINLWLAPGINLHRNPICGRTFEYFSEDPFLSAANAIAMTKGVQRHPGRGTTIKHMAANNQETNRTSHNSNVSERTMRELYLRGFELAVKYSNPYAVMTSLNCVNGPHGTNSRELATYILRDEWGYKGLVTTDWSTTTPARGGSTTGCINAGNDIIMPGSERDIEKMTAALHNLSGTGDKITIGALQKCAAGVLRYILRTGNSCI
ncbi:MAG: glycoside hydrolase family 3 N-terminal domain-containing protein [Oscillospiraceae bacterium]|jgi:hypothetical protein